MMIARGYWHGKETGISRVSRRPRISKACGSHRETAGIARSRQGRRDQENARRLRQKSRQLGVWEVGRTLLLRRRCGCSCFVDRPHHPDWESAVSLHLPTHTGLPVRVWRGRPRPRLLIFRVAVENRALGVTTRHAPRYSTVVRPSCPPVGFKVKSRGRGRPRHTRWPW